MIGFGRYTETFYIHSVERRVIVESALRKSVCRRYSVAYKTARRGKTFAYDVIPRRKSRSFFELTVELRYAYEQDRRDGLNGQIFKQVCVYIIGGFHSKRFGWERMGGVCFFTENALLISPSRE